MKIVAFKKKTAFYKGIINFPTSNNKIVFFSDPGIQMF